MLIFCVFSAFSICNLMTDNLESNTRIWDALCIQGVWMLIFSVFCLLFSATVGQYTFSILFACAVAYCGIVVLFVMISRFNWMLIIMLLWTIYILLVTLFVFFFDLSSFFVCRIDACAHAFFVPFVLLYVSNAFLLGFSYQHVGLIWNLLNIVYVEEDSFEENVYYDDNEQ